MGDPPGGSSYPSLKWDKSKEKTFHSPGPKYLIMTRVNSEIDLKNVSPFLIKKAIDNTCTEQIEECKKLRNGTILIKTKNSTQASKLLTLTALSSNIDIEITEHKTLNNSKGVVYCNDLRGINEEEILFELKSQLVIEVKKIMKKSGDDIVETGLICLTFATLNLPSKINIGYQKINVRAYIPQPTRCNNCFNYGHIGKYCTLPKICYNCAHPYHLSDRMTTCVLTPNCVNCKKLEISPCDHASSSKNCPIFIKHKEILAIRTTYKVDQHTATTIYNEKHQHNAKTFSSVLISSSNSFTPANTTTTNTVQTTGTSPPIPKRTAIDYSDLNELASVTSLTTKNSNTLITKTKNNVKILPLSTSKRIQNQLKNHLKPKNSKESAKKVYDNMNVDSESDNT